jgi:hypothetical protein
VLANLEALQNSLTSTRDLFRGVYVFEGIPWVQFPKRQRNDADRVSRLINLEPTGQPPV